MNPSTRYPRMISRRSLIASGILALGATAGIAVPLATRGSFYPGTMVSEADISELSMDEARQVLQAHFADFEAEAIDYVFEDQQWTASLADLGYRIDYDATLEAAYKHGRDGGVFDRYTGVLVSTDQARYPVVFTQEEGTLPTFLEQIGPEIKGAARDARIYLSEGSVRVLDNRDGRQLDVDSAVQETRAAIPAATRSTVELTTLPVISQITSDDLEPIRQQAETLISSALTIVAGDTRWTVPTDMLIHALVLPEEGELSAPYLDQDALAEGMQDIVDEMYTPPVNAVVGWDDGPYAVENDTPGQEVDVDALTAALAETAASPDDRSLNLPLKDVSADVRADNLAELGITTFLAEGSSSFAGSSEARAENVRVSAEHVTHTLIPPGENCSFNDSLGPISLDNGFVEGKIIKGEWIESDLGGGACQASTTVFRAALYAGLPFVEWNPHSFRLAFYEADGSEPGIDAAIYQPNNEWEWELDLIFTNPTDSWMLMEMTTEGDTAITSLYGTPTGYDVDVTVPYISDPIKPDGPLEKVDDKLQKGDRQQITTAADGYKVIMHRKVTREGEVISDVDFVSNYQPQRETWLIGPGTKRQFPDDPDADATEEAQ
ncbi:MAG TPA: VanW family protein [Thermomicrobiales bacterium]|nr:VanW family protein [Thermomicrobiales bacterium]